jgi:uncharacterized membrane protein
LLKYLIQCVENLLTAGLLTAFAAAAVYGAEKKRRIILLSGGAVGAVAALVLAVLRSETRLINREQINLFLLPALLAAGIVFLLLILGTPRNRPPADAPCVAASVLLALLFFYALPDVLLYPGTFRMADESVFSTDVLFKAVGWAGGILLAFLTGAAVYRTVVALPQKYRRVVAALAVFVGLLSQTAVFLQTLLARRIIPMRDFLFDLLQPVMNHSIYFGYALLALGLFCAVALFLRNRRIRESYENPAQLRKLKAAARRGRRGAGSVLCVALLCVLTLTAAKAYTTREVVLSPAEPMQIVGAQIRISMESVGDGHLHRFAYTAKDGTEMRFIVIKKNEASFGVGLDACDICGATGYYERENEVVCKLCDVVMNKSTIGFKGGCNPVPLAFTLAQGNMVVETADLEKESIRFK